MDCCCSGPSAFAAAVVVVVAAAVGECAFGVRRAGQPATVGAVVFAVGPQTVGKSMRGVAIPPGGTRGNGDHDGKIGGPASGSKLGEEGPARAGGTRERRPWPSTAASAPPSTAETAAGRTASSSTGTGGAVHAVVVAAMPFAGADTRCSSAVDRGTSSGVPRRRPCPSLADPPMWWWLMLTKP